MCANYHHVYMKYKMLNESLNIEFTELIESLWFVFLLKAERYGVQHSVPETLNKNNALEVFLCQTHFTSD